MGYPVKRASTTRPLTFLMVNSIDHITGELGLSPTVTLSKNGLPFAAPAGAVSEIGGGWYQVAANATDNNTLGVLILQAIATGADPTDERFEVVAYDPDNSVNLGLSGLSIIGSGAISHTYTLYTSGNVPISNAEVWITTDLAGSNVIAGPATTDSFGQVIFLLDAGSYYVWRQKPGYNFTNPKALTVTP